MANEKISPDDYQKLAYLLSTMQKDPLRFVENMFRWGRGELEGQTILDWQRKVLEAVRDRSPKEALQIAVTSGHGVGKSTLVAWLILWAISTSPCAKGVVTANTENQLKNKTWSELTKWHRMSLVKPLFEVCKMSIISRDKKLEGIWRVDAVAWNEGRPESFAGLHNQGGRILIIFDEASAIPDIIWEVAEGALTDKDTDLMFFCFGNPTRNEGRFKECFAGQRHRWQTFKVDSRDVPITNKTQINKWIADYGIDSNFVKVRVLGEFPAEDNQTLISREEVEWAMDRSVPDDSYAENFLCVGMDVARFGDDRSVIAIRQGTKLFPLRKFSGLNTMQAADELIKVIRLYEPDDVFVDIGGVGAGVYDRVRELGYRITPIDFGAAPMERSKYTNKRSEIWCKMADWVRTADLPQDDELLQDLITPRYYFRGDNGQIQLERKSDIKKRGGSSPDCADAVALTFSYLRKEESKNYLASKELR